jgi:hypothetical protein
MPNSQIGNPEENTIFNLNVRLCYNYGKPSPMAAGFFNCKSISVFKHYKTLNNNIMTTKTRLAETVIF